MYPNYQNAQNTSYSNNYNKYPMNYNNDRQFGFFGPFILGGITGGLLAPAFYPRPNYRPYPYPPYPPYPPPFYR